MKGYVWILAALGAVFTLTVPLAGAASVLPGSPTPTSAPSTTFKINVVFVGYQPTDMDLTGCGTTKSLYKHYADFKSGYDEHCEKQYGFFWPVVDEMVRE